MGEVVTEGVKVPRGAITAGARQIDGRIHSDCVDQFVLGLVDGILNAMDPGLIVIGVIEDRLDAQLGGKAAIHRYMPENVAANHVRTFFVGEGVLGGAGLAGATNKDENCLGGLKCTLKNFRVAEMKG